MPKLSKAQFEWLLMEDARRKRDEKIMVQRMTEQLDSMEEEIEKTREEMIKMIDDLPARIMKSVRDKLAVSGIMQARTTAVAPPANLNSSSVEVKVENQAVEVGSGFLTHEQKIEMINKFLDDLPAFFTKELVNPLRAKYLDGTIFEPTTPANGSSSSQPAQIKTENDEKPVTYVGFKIKREQSNNNEDEHADKRAKLPPTHRIYGGLYFYEAEDYACSRYFPPCFGESFKWTTVTAACEVFQFGVPDYVDRDGNPFPVQPFRLMTEKYLYPKKCKMKNLFKKAHAIFSALVQSAIEGGDLKGEEDLKSVTREEWATLFTKHFVLLVAKREKETGAKINRAAQLSVATIHNKLFAKPKAAAAATITPSTKEGRGDGEDDDDEGEIEAKEDDDEEKDE